MLAAESRQYGCFLRTTPWDVDLSKLKTLHYKNLNLAQMIKFVSAVIKLLADMPVLGSSNSAANIKLWCQKYGQMGIQLFNWVENIVGKGEIAHNEQFLLFPQCFLKLFLMHQNEFLWSKELKGY